MWSREKGSRMIMRNGTFYTVLLSSFLLACTCITGCGSSPNPGALSQKSGSPPTLEERVDAVMNSMTLQEKIGQMVMIGIEGKEVNEDSLFMLHQYHVGGITLFDRNMETRDQVRKLTEQLQQQAEEKVPLFIAADEEGGMVVRMRDQLPELPSQEEIGATGDPAQAQAWGASIGKLVKDMGINTNFAPVADVGSEGGRSYSRDPDTAAVFVDRAVQGYEAERVFCSLKHFPGIGRGMVDSHVEVSDIDISREELLASDLKPFRTVMGSHDPAGYFIMVSHLKYPQLDPAEPASLSRPVVTGLLRETLGYDGIVITDDLTMGAVAKHNSYRELGVKAVQAGADIALVCHEYSNQQEVYLGLLEAVEKGIISRDRIDASVKRIVRAKLTYLQQEEGK